MTHSGSEWQPRPLSSELKEARREVERLRACLRDAENLARHWQTIAADRGSALQSSGLAL